MKEAVALDAAGNEYASLADPQPLAQGAGQLHELGLAVPTSTNLVSLRLADGFTLDLSST